MTLSENEQRAKAKSIAEEAVRILDLKKGDDLKLICVREKTPLADYFVISTANSSTQLHGMSDELLFRLSERLGETPRGVEGKDGWILLDYTSVIIHIFTPEARDFYKLEKLWSDGEEIDISGIVATEEQGK